jgi:hypothetical protein
VAGRAKTSDLDMAEADVRLLGAGHLLDALSGSVS